MSLRRREVVLSVSVEFTEHERILTRDSRQSDFPTEVLERDLHDIVEHRLPKDLEHLYGLSVRTRIIDTRYSSVTVFFGVVIAGFNLLASYRDFVESMHLIRSHCSDLVHGHLRSRRWFDLDARVAFRFPRIPEIDDLYPARRFRRRFGVIAREFWEPLAGLETGPESARPRRDGFFWFLLILNTVLLAAVAALVWSAVAGTYFGR